MKNKNKIGTPKKESRENFFFNGKNSFNWKNERTKREDKEQIRNSWSKSLKVQYQRQIFLIARRKGWVVNLQKKQKEV